MRRKTFKFRSFRYAVEGFFTLVRNEPNARIHLAAAGLAFIAGLLFHLSAFEWLFIVASIVLVLASELINSAIEKLADIVKPEPDPVIKSAKDYSAAAVMISALFSVIVAGVIFLPKVVRLIKG